MMAIMEAESTTNGISCNKDAVGDTSAIAGVLAVSCGLFQIRTISPERGTCDQLKDPAFNIKKAYGIYRGQGLTAWSVYTNGNYIKYLK